MQIFPVILAGGAGSRLWPLSRQNHPKQLLKLLDDSSLLQNTLARIPKNSDFERPIVIANTEFRFIIAEQLRAMDIQADIILEPFGRNTAPAVAVAAIHAMQSNPNAILLVMPADHAILKKTAWENAVHQAHAIACQDFLVTFGVKPDSPMTGYGYIKPGDALEQENTFSVAEFVEKPNVTQANDYIKNGYLWNSGIFMFSAKKYLSELEKFEPMMKRCCEAALETGHVDLDFFRLNQSALETCPSSSVDYAVMEKTAHAAVIPVEMGWSDIGSWSALHDISEKDMQGNSVIGDVICQDTKNSYLRAENRMLAVLGLKDCILVETTDVVLAAHKDYVQNVKEIVSQLKLSQRNEVEVGCKVFRPWGWYETLVEAPGFKVKEIMVNPGAKLSLQSHHHRSEHWVVVSGKAQVVQGEEEFFLNAGQSTFISLKTKHRLSNVTNQPLRIIEVQCGHYLGEDDIERFEDVFGRVVAIP